MTFKDKVKEDTQGKKIIDTVDSSGFPGTRELTISEKLDLIIEILEGK
jgi:hypothetical protein